MTEFLKSHPSPLSAPAFAQEEAGEDNDAVTAEDVNVVLPYYFADFREGEKSDSLPPPPNDFSTSTKQQSHSLFLLKVCAFVFVFCFFLLSF